LDFIPEINDKEQVVWIASDNQDEVVLYDGIGASQIISNDIHALKDTNNLTKSEAEMIVALFFDKMAEALAKRDRVGIRGLCSFYVKKYGGYTGRNPKTGESQFLPRKVSK
jgi:integration host factor subunit beta